MEKLKPPSNDFEVFGENWPTVQIFKSLHSQWIVGPMGGVVGLNYQSVEILLRLEDVENKAEMFLNIQVMEATALNILNEKKKKA